MTEERSRRRAPIGLYVEESGTPGSDSIGFLHADGVSGRMWTDHLETVSEYHCLVPDLPGSGRSTHLSWRSLDHTADLVAGLVRDRVPARRTHLVGESLGEAVSHRLLARHSELFDAVIVARGSSRTGSPRS